MEEGKLYRPSNGTEGECFMSMYCNHCIHDHPDMDKEPKCDIIACSMAFDTDDTDYPKEWVYGADGNPTCTAYVKWDWGNEEDGWNDPQPPPEPDNPNQLCLPFMMDEILEDYVPEKKKELV